MNCTSVWQYESVCSPASSGCQVNLKVSDDSVDQGFHKGHRQAHQSGGDDKGPGWEEEVVPLFEKHRQPLDLHSGDTFKGVLHKPTKDLMYDNPNIDGQNNINHCQCWTWCACNITVYSSMTVGYGR